MRRNISTDRYDVKPNARSVGAHVDLSLVKRSRLWELNGEPMETAGEVIANIGLLLEHLDREAAKGPSQSQSESEAGVAK
ncbi:MAG: hypothetical protein AVDCRST_MAG53-1640 [uncultured Solirubrobacteraceae bacterium]|uniref:Uncharacterized protein n=1 Tax=uncultured Solirubrobacteraceae bacterium TaxID=1162706 RepID=A0A6J4S9J7_9ACTN|nr:MAG: hypothetical protein AVDCRST_MAG53-1640 [uncultured Solirubrobacteraceae bacterium]